MQQLTPAAAHCHRSPRCRVAIANIAILFVGFSLALVGVSCDTTECRRADNIGQFITALAALSLAVVASYMSFLVGNHS